MSHLSQDSCAIAAADTMSRSHLDYMMNPIKYQHNNQCAPSFNIIGGNQQAHLVVGAGLVDLETRIQRGEGGNTRCPSYNYQPLMNGDMWSPECDQFKFPQKKPIDVRTIPLQACQFSSNPALIPSATMGNYMCPMSL